MDLFFFLGKIKANEDIAVDATGCENENSDIGLNCSDLYNCCSCGSHGCGCRYCFDCNACEYCLNDE